MTPWGADAFLINVPVAIIALVGTLLWAPETRDAHAQHGADVPGVILSIVGLGGIVFGLIEGQRFGWWKTVDQLRLGGFTWTWQISPAPIAFALGMLVTVEFVLVERSR